MSFFLHTGDKDVEAGDLAAVGNRLRQVRSLGGQQSTDLYQYDVANRLWSVNDTSYVWDNNGNLINDGVNSYTYDAANRLRSLTGPYMEATFAYDGPGGSDAAEVQWADGDLRTGSECGFDAGAGGRDEHLPIGRGPNRAGARWAR